VWVESQRPRKSLGIVLSKKASQLQFIDFHSLSDGNSGYRIIYLYQVVFRDSRSVSEIRVS